MAEAPADDIEAVPELLDRQTEAVHNLQDHIVEAKTCLEPFVYPRAEAQDWSEKVVTKETETSESSSPEEERRALQWEINNAKVQLENMRYDLLRYSIENKDLKSQLQQNERKRKTLELCTKYAEKQAATYYSKLQDQISKHEIEESRVASLQSQFEHKDEECKIPTARANNTEQQAAIFLEKYLQLQDQIKRLTAKLESKVVLESETEEYKHRNHELQDEISGLKAEVEALQQENRELQDSLSRLGVRASSTYPGGSREEEVHFREKKVQGFNRQDDRSKHGVHATNLKKHSR